MSSLPVSNFLKETHTPRDIQRRTHAHIRTFYHSLTRARTLTVNEMQQTTIEYAVDGTNYQRVPHPPSPSYVQDLDTTYYTHLVSDTKIAEFNVVARFEREDLAWQRTNQDHI